MEGRPGALAPPSRHRMPIPRSEIEASGPQPHRPAREGAPVHRLHSPRRPKLRPEACATPTRPTPDTWVPERPRSSDQRQRRSANDHRLTPLLAHNCTPVHFNVSCRQVAMPSWDTLLNGNFPYIVACSALGASHICCPNASKYALQSRLVRRDLASTEPPWSLTGNRRSRSPKVRCRWSSESLAIPKNALPYNSFRCGVASSGAAHPRHNSHKCVGPVRRTARAPTTTGTTGPRTGRIATSTRPVEITSRSTGTVSGSSRCRPATGTDPARLSPGPTPSPR